MLIINDKFNVVSGFQNLEVYINDRLYTTISPSEGTKTIEENILLGSNIRVQKGRFTSNTIKLEDTKNPVNLYVTYLLPNSFGIFAYLSFFASMTLLWFRYDNIYIGLSFLIPILILVYYKLFRKNSMLRLLF